MSIFAALTAVLFWAAATMTEQICVLNISNVFTIITQAVQKSTCRFSSLSFSRWLQLELTLGCFTGKGGMDRGAGGQDHQARDMRRGPLHLQAQRQGQEGQVVSQEPGRKMDWYSSIQNSQVWQKLGFWNGSCIDPAVDLGNKQSNSEIWTWCGKSLHYMSHQACLKDIQFCQ